MSNVNNGRIYIGLCADEKFALPLGVCLTSIFESNPGKEIGIFILTDGFSYDTIQRLNETSKFYGKSIEIIKVDKTIFCNHPVSSIFPQSIYYRYLFAELLPTKIDKIIYLDSDTIVVGDISSLWETNVEGFAIGAVEDANGDDIIIRNRIGVFDGRYLNSGVLLINLKYWRERDSFSLLTRFIKENPEKCVYPDQDALNVVFHDEVRWLSFRNNFQICLAERDQDCRLHRCHDDDILDSFSNLVVIHYSSIYNKPWFKDSRHPLIFVWKYFYQISKWRDFPLGLQFNWYKCLIKKILKMEPYRETPSIKPIFKEKLLEYTLKFKV